MTPEGKRLHDFLRATLRELRAGPMVQELKRPMELAALKGRLERAQRVQTKIGETGERLDKVLDEIEEKEAQASGHAGQLEQYNTALEATIKQMIGGSNEPPVKKPAQVESPTGQPGDKQEITAKDVGELSVEVGKT